MRINGRYTEAKQNSCGLVSPQGETKSEQVSSFKDIWRPFVEINTRYDEAKSKYDAYTLRQVLSIFENKGTKVAYKYRKVL